MTFCSTKYWGSFIVLGARSFIRKSLTGAFAREIVKISVSYVASLKVPALISITEFINTDYTVMLHINYLKEVDFRKKMKI